MSQCQLAHSSQEIASSTCHNTFTGTGIFFTVMSEFHYILPVMGGVLHGLTHRPVLCRCGSGCFVVRLYGANHWPRSVEKSLSGGIDGGDIQSSQYRQRAERRERKSD